MAQLSCTFFSEVLGTETNLCVVLPDPKNFPGVSSPKFQTLTLLHGFSDNQSDWLRKSSAERYACDRCLALVLPFADKSFYTDMAYGDRWWTYISEELPAVARAYFPLSERREDNFVAGNSMGGYGAFKLALRHPERYAAAVSFSGALDMATVAHFGAEQMEGMAPPFSLVFGDLDSVGGSENDLLHLLRANAAAKNNLPALQMYCGRQDFLLEANHRFKALADGLRVPCGYVEEEGDHDWPYWDRWLRQALDWLPLRGAPVEE